ncbi:MAG: hypothetical protein H6645_05450 [Caldilineaceae bacterium]|nr:hypothetical protein [Caldilineaceae bacterium]
MACNFDDLCSASDRRKEQLGGSGNFSPGASQIYKSSSGAPKSMFTPLPSKVNLMKLNMSQPLKRAVGNQLPTIFQVVDLNLFPARVRKDIVFTIMSNMASTAIALSSTCQA